MVHKEVKASSSITTVVITLLLFFSIMTGLFYFLLDMSSKQDVEVEGKYNDSFYNLVNKQEELSTEVEEINQLSKNITAGQTDFFTWNTFKGLGSILKVPIKFVGIGIDTVDIVSAPMDDTTPAWALTVLRIGIMAVVILIVLGALTGGNQKL